MSPLYTINTEVPALGDSLSRDTNQCVRDITTLVPTPTDFVPEAVHKITHTNIELQNSAEISFLTQNLHSGSAHLNQSMGIRTAITSSGSRQLQLQLQTGENIPILWPQWQLHAAWITPSEAHISFKIAEWGRSQG